MTPNSLSLSLQERCSTPPIIWFVFSRLTPTGPCLVFGWNCLAPASDTLPRPLKNSDTACSLHHSCHVPAVAVHPAPAPAVFAELCCPLSQGCSLSPAACIHKAAPASAALYPAEPEQDENSACLSLAPSALPNPFPVRV